MKVFGGFGPLFMLHCIMCLCACESERENQQVHVCLQNEHEG